MLIFRNPGLIDILAVTTMGVSVKNPGSFGYFGTGLKYSIATILRNGGVVTIHRGSEAHVFTSTTRTIRGEPFQFVRRNRQVLGFTTDLGKTWEAWMVLRELGCNARDEGGTFVRVPEWGFEPPADDETVIAVSGWNVLEQAYEDRATIFAEGEPLAVTDALRVLTGPSDYLYYRGVRVHKLDKPSWFRYDLLAQQTLTEDRTLAHTYGATGAIRAFLLGCEDEELLNAALTTGPNNLEGKLDFADAWQDPSRAFLDAVINARDAKERNLSPTARGKALKALRQASENRVERVRTSYKVEDQFTLAVDYLDNLGLELGDRPVIIVDELPGNAKSVAENGRVYILRALTRAPVVEIVEQLARRELDLLTYGDGERLVDILLPMLMRTNADLFRALAHKAKGEQDDEEEAA